MWGQRSGIRGKTQYFVVPKGNAAGKGEPRAGSQGTAPWSSRLRPPLTVLQLVSKLTMLWSKGVTWLEMRTLTR